MRAWHRLALVLAILVFVPQLWEQFEAPKAIVVRVIGLGALAAAAVAARPRRDAWSVRWQPLDVAMVAWVLIECILSATSRAPRLSVFGDAEQHAGLVTSLGLFGLFVSARRCHGPAEAERTLRVVVAAAVVASLYALAQVAGLDPSPWRDTAQYASGQFMRPFATLAHPNLLGIITSAAWAVALAMAVQSRTARWAWAGAALVLGAVTVATLSRAAWLGAGAGGVVALAAALRVDPERAPRLSRMILGAIVAALIAAALFASVGMLRDRFMELIAPTAGPSRARLEIWRAALGMWRDHPWFGVGPDAFGLLYFRYQTPEYWRFEWGTQVRHAHSIYLQVLATGGVLGVAAAAGAFVALLAALRTGWSRGAETRRALAPIMAALAAVVVAGAFGALGIAGAALVGAMIGTVASLAGNSVTSGSAAASVEQGIVETRGKGAAGAAHRRDRERTAGRERMSGPERTASPERIADRERVAARERRSRSAGGAAPAHIALWIGLVVAAGVLVSHAVELAASRAALYAREYQPRSAGEVRDPTSTQAADRAMSLEPGSDWIANLRGQVYLAHVTALEPALAARGVEGLDPALRAAVDRWLAEAENSARGAIALEPLRALNYQTLGNVLIARTRWGEERALPQALEAYRECWKRSPVNALAQLQFAYEALRLGRADLAAEPARRAASLYPDQALAEIVWGRVALALGDTATATRAFERGLPLPWRDMPYARSEVEELLGRLHARP